MRRKGMRLLLVLSLLLGAVIWNVSAASSTSYSISLTPNKTSAQVGDSVSVTVNISPTDWSGINLRLTYDRAKLDLTTTSTDLGCSLSENTPGIVRIIGYEKKNLTLNFEAVAAGDAEIEITYAGIANQDSSIGGEDIPATLPTDPTVITVTPLGYTVSGQVKSYNPNNPVTVKLMQSGVEKYSTTIAAASGSGQTTGNFSISSVPDGTYDLVVTKPCHLTYTVKDVAVNGADVDLTAAASSKPYKLITMLAGDVNGDTYINESDVSVVRFNTNINHATTDAANPLADVNGDGSVNESDVNIIRYTVHINKEQSDCTFNY